MTTIYKILNTKTGLYSKGGTNAIVDDEWAWGRTGKHWLSRKAVGLHLKLFITPDGRNLIPDHWVVQSFKLVEAGRPMDAKEFLAQNLDVDVSKS